MPAQSQQPENLRASVIECFCRIATTPDQERKFPVGPESGKKLGYEPAEVDALPSAFTESFCGVGNPFSLGAPDAGQTIINLGCETGFDTLVVAKPDVHEVHQRTVLTKNILNLMLSFRESSPSLGKMDGISFRSSKPSFPMVGRQVSTDAT